MSAEVLITAGAGVLAALVTAWFAFRSSRSNTHVQEVQTVIGAYAELVESLRTEVDRLREQIAEMHLEMARCEQRNSRLAEELAGVKYQVSQLEKKRG